MMKLAINRFGANWVNSSWKKFFIFTKSFLKISIKYLINISLTRENWFPAGSDAAPFMANLSLYYHENKWT